MVKPHVDVLKFWCQKVLPLVYDDSLSYYELLNKVVQKLNETVEAVNSYGEFITSEVDRQLNELIADGTISNLINTQIFNELNNRVDTNTKNIDKLTTDTQTNTTNINSLTPIVNALNTIKTNKDYGSFSEMVGHRIISYPLANKNYSKTSNAPYTQQGGTYYEKDGVPYFAMGVIDYEISGLTTTIYIINLNTSEIVNSQALGLGHCNSLHFYNDKFVVSLLSTGGVPSVSILNYNLSQVTNFSVPETQDGTLPINTYDCLGAQIIDDVVYVGGEKNLYKYDLTGNYIGKISVNYPQNGLTTYQDFYFDGTNYYMVFAFPNRIVKFDANLNYVTTYMLSDYADNMFKIYEAENISVANNKFYVGFTSPGTQSSYYNVNDVVEFNLSGESLAFIDYSYIYRQAPVYIDPISAGIFADGSQSHPFKTFAQAMQIKNDIGLKIIVSGNLIEGINITGRNNLSVTGNNSNAGLLLVRGCNNVSISGFNITNTDYSPNLASVVTYSSNLDMRNMVFSQTYGSDYTLNLSTSYIRLFNITFNSENNLLRISSSYVSLINNIQGLNSTGTNLELQNQSTLVGDSWSNISRVKFDRHSFFPKLKIDETPKFTGALTPIIPTGLTSYNGMTAIFNITFRGQTYNVSFIVPDSIGYVTNSYTNGTTYFIANSLIVNNALSVSASYYVNLTDAPVYGSEDETLKAKINSIWIQNG